MSMATVSGSWSDTTSVVIVDSTTDLTSTVYDDYDIIYVVSEDSFCIGDPNELVSVRDLHLNYERLQAEAIKRDILEVDWAMWIIPSIANCLVSMTQCIRTWNHSKANRPRAPPDC